MKNFLRLAAVLLCSAPVFAQYSVPGTGGGGASSTVSVTQGGNTAVVDASGRLSTGLNAVGGTAITLGQKTGASSLPIVIASDQSAVPVSGTVTANISGSISNTAFTANGSQSQALKQTATNFNLASELYTGGTAYDARQVRALTSADQVTLANASITTIGGASTAVIGKVAPVTSCGTTVKDTGAITLTSTAAAPTAMNATTCIVKVFVSNTDTASHTFTLTDGQGSPITYVSGFSLAAKSTYLIDLGGMAFNTGIKWQADAPSVLVAQAIGVQ